MIIEAVLIGLLATVAQWWFFGPITKCLVYPLTTGLLVGIIMGDPILGMMAGANIQLIYLGWISAGGTIPSNTMVAGILGTSMTILSGASPALAVTFAIPFSMLGLLSHQLYMTFNSFAIHKADTYLEKGNLDGVWFMNFIPSFCLSLLLNGVPAFLLVFFGKDWAMGLLNMVPERFIHALEVVGGIMPALGIAMLLSFLYKREIIAFFFAGFFLTIYLKLDTMSVAIFGSVIATLVYIASTRRQASEADDAFSGNTNEADTPDTTSGIRLRKRDLVKTWLYTTSTEACYNYERLQALGAATLMLPVVKRLYPTNEKRVEELKKYMVFYNSEVFTVGPVINGIAASMEEARANGGDVSAEDINAVRTGLMGPVAGIGDTVMQGILFPILAGIGCTMALDGNLLGPVFFTVVFEVLIFTCGYNMFMLGYKQGKNSILRILKSGTIDKITNAFSIVGLMVVGTMAASRVNVITPVVLSSGQDKVLTLQGVLDSLLPGLIALVLTLGIWKMLQKKFNAIYIIIAIFVVGILTSYLGILGIK
ncbi:PTS system mannose/fructose/sorbose family transporter subunit IID [Enterobacter sp. CP102]|uniref:PTS system mannose/fructose/sorbose family transporter subunit IID n=1 Tax=Enterobacter sp. CP102 TaxID=2976431 RepID=UPI0021E26159|nr:PTS system mannose/fructose/sorbose family transporter subunit IID [Enterobacter sp. CP102]UWM63502.1 PTS system mannose/fructose/sorbose family transporter subunit IID [Enterobacter sp. CP102]